MTIHTINPKDRLIEAFESHCGSNIASLFQVFLDKFPTGVFKSWEHKPDGRFTLILEKPLKLWSPSDLEADPKGPAAGGIMILEEFVEGSLDRMTKTVTFTRGLTNFCKIKVPFLGEKEVNITICSFKHISEEKLELHAGLRVLGKLLSEARLMPAKSFILNWKNNGEVTHDDHVAFLHQKINVLGLR